MDFITNSERSSMVVESLSSVKSKTVQHGGDINSSSGQLLSDNIINKLHEITKNTNLMKGGFKKDNDTVSSETSDTVGSESDIASDLGSFSLFGKKDADNSQYELTGGSSDVNTHAGVPAKVSAEVPADSQSSESENSDSISSLSSATSTSLKSIQSGGAGLKRNYKSTRKSKSINKSINKSKNKSKSKVTVDISEQDTYLINNGDYLLSDSNLFTVTG